ncbi:MAG: PilZ domain-containing protein [Spirochaetes bacterium]|nr:PilZ domain-containing protein [Spirochaetota bacterium]
MLILFLIALLILFLASMTLFIRGTNRYSPIEFYSRAKEVGFGFSEANLIKKTAALANCEDPTNVFWSIHDLDAVIKYLSASQRREGTEKKRENVQFMEKIFEFRKKLEFDQPKYHIGIKSSRMIRLNQRLKVLLPGMGVFNATIIENNERCLSITLPVGGKVPAGFSWKGAKISVYFWRQDDAGYVFDTYVLEEVRVRNIPVLQLGHSDALFRTQKRKSLRIRSQLPSYLYLLKHLHGAYEKPERVPGMKCILQDISEDGASILIGGKAKPGMLVKIQTWLNEDQIVISGTVRSADFDAAKNQSQLHIEAIQPSPRMRNLIRSHVYNTREQAGNDDSVFDENVFSTR